jgi:hypothetical protein
MRRAFAHGYDAPSPPTALHDRIFSAQFFSLYSHGCGDWIASLVAAGFVAITPFSAELVIAETPPDDVTGPDVRSLVAVAQVEFVPSVVRNLPLCVDWAGKTAFRNAGFEIPPPVGFTVPVWAETEATKTRSNTRYFMIGSEGFRFGWFQRK